MMINNEVKKYTIHMNGGKEFVTTKRPNVVERAIYGDGWVTIFVENKPVFVNVKNADYITIEDVPYDGDKKYGEKNERTDSNSKQVQFNS